MFRVGNVVKTAHDHLVIVTDVKTDKIKWVSFDYTGSSGITKLKTSNEEKDCLCHINNGGYHDDECPYCHGEGTYMESVPGFDQAKVLDNNVKEYILKRLLKNFDF